MTQPQSLEQQLRDSIAHVQQNGPHAVQNGANVLKFATNVPEELALKFADGLAVEGRYGPQVMYTLTDERKMYVPPIVADKLRACGIQPGERITISKREKAKGKGVEWAIERVDPRGGPAPHALTPTTTATPAARPGLSQERVGVTSANGQVHSTEPAVLDTISQQARLMTHCLCRSIDSCVAATKYAEAAGFSVEFLGEDVEKLAVTLYMQHVRGGAPCR